MRVRDAHDLIKSEKNDFRYRRNRGYTLPKVKRAIDCMMTSFFVSCIKLHQFLNLNELAIAVVACSVVIYVATLSQYLLKLSVFYP